MSHWFVNLFPKAHAYDYNFMTPLLCNMFRVPFRDIWVLRCSYPWNFCGTHSGQAHVKFIDCFVLFCTLRLCSMYLVPFGLPTDMYSYSCLL